MDGQDMRMAKTDGEAKSELLQLQVVLEDELSRLEALCHLGGLAADGMQGLHEDPSATAFSFYFSLLGAEIDKLRRGCGAKRQKP